MYVRIYEWYRSTGTEDSVIWDLQYRRLGDIIFRYFEITTCNNIEEINSRNQKTRIQKLHNIVLSSCMPFYAVSNKSVAV